VIRSIDYVGIKSVSVSDILDRFKERKVGLAVESAVRSEQGAARGDRPEGAFWASAGMNTPP
jgi:hypothetical protein